MLPGFRFLFAAIVLSMSVLVFGLGAAALLRAAHEEVASSVPLWRALPEQKFAQPSETPRETLGDPATPVLAMLRVEPEPAQLQAMESTPAVAAPAEPPATGPAPDAPEKFAALASQDTTPPEAAKPEISVAEPSVQSAPTPPDAPAPPVEQKIAAAEPAAALANDAAPPASEPASPPAAATAGIGATRIATLGGPSVVIEAQPTAKTAAGTSAAKPDQSVAKERLQARRAAQRRRIALRARQAAQQQAADPFAQITPRSR